MEKTTSKLGLASLILGLANPVLCLLVLLFSNLIGLIIVVVGVPLAGILCGIAGLFGPVKIRFMSAAGIVLNLLPIAAIAILWALFQNSETFGIWR